MNLASISENHNIEKRIAITPEIAKKYISLGFNLILPNNYGSHLGFDDEEYKSQGVKILDNEKDIIDQSDIIVQLSLPSEKILSNLNHYFASNTRQPLHTDYAYYEKSKSIGYFEVATPGQYTVSVTGNKQPRIFSFGKSQPLIFYGFILIGAFLLVPISFITGLLLVIFGILNLVKGSQPPQKTPPPVQTPPTTDSDYASKDYRD